MEFIQRTGAELMEPRSLQGIVKSWRNRTAAGKTCERLHIGVFFTVVSIAVTQEHLIAIAKLVVQPRRGLIFTGVIGEKAAIAFQLAIQELVAHCYCWRRSRGWTHCKETRKDLSANVSRELWSTSETWN